MPIVSDDPIWVQIGDSDPQLIPRGQLAALLRFLPSYESGESVVMEHMSFALGGCYKIDQILSALRNDLGIPIPCDLVPKKTKPGTYGLYYLGQGVRRWEPSKAPK